MIVTNANRFSDLTVLPLCSPATHSVPTAVKLVLVAMLLGSPGLHGPPSSWPVSSSASASAATKLAALAPLVDNDGDATAAFVALTMRAVALRMTTLSVNATMMNVPAKSSALTGEEDNTSDEEVFSARFDQHYLLNCLARDMIL